MRIIVVPAGRFGTAAARAFLDLAGGYDRPLGGLATGNTPVPMYDALRGMVDGGQAGIEGIEPFAIDEYLGPRDHPCSNRAFFRLWWESIPGARAVEQFEVDTPDPAAEAERFSGVLDKRGGLDVAVLGIGLNGHVAFNEPGSALDQRASVVDLAEATRRSAAACWGEATPKRGLTLGLAELLGAREVLLLANGTAKAAIVARALEGPAGPECPASFFRAHPNLVVVLDEAAAAELRGQGKGVGSG